MMNSWRAGRRRETKLVVAAVALANSLHFCVLVTLQLQLPLQLYRAMSSSVCDDDFARLVSDCYVGRSILSFSHCLFVFFIGDKLAACQGPAPSALAPLPGPRPRSLARSKRRPAGWLAEINAWALGRTQLDFV